MRQIIINQIEDTAIIYVRRPNMWAWEGYDEAVERSFFDELDDDEPEWGDEVTDED